MSDEAAEALGRYDIVAGHISIDDIDRYFPDAPLFTVMREPVDRCISWYYFARKQGAMEYSDVTAAQEHSLDDFFSLETGITYRNIYNRHVRQLGGHALDVAADMDSVCAKAQETLKQCVWVGRYESLYDDMQRLGAIFPEMAGVQLPHLNSTGTRIAIDQIDAVRRARVSRYNRYDIALYTAFSGPSPALGAQS